MSSSAKEVEETRKLFVLIALTITFLLGSMSTLAIQQYTQRIENKAAVKVVGVGIYKDINFTASVTQIDWGLVEPGENKTYSAYIVNKSNVPLNLSMRTENWSPTNASDFIALTWDYAGDPLAIDDYIPITLTLHVNSAISDIRGFSFDIVIVGSG